MKNRDGLWRRKDDVRKIQSVFDDEYDYDVAKMMDILKQNSERSIPFRILGDFQISEARSAYQCQS